MEATTVVFEDPAPQELFIFGHRSAAHAAGFRTSRHPIIPWARAWLLDQDEPHQIQGLYLSRVYVTDSAPRSADGVPPLQRKLDEAKHIARRQLRVAPMLWMEI